MDIFSLGKKKLFSSPQKKEGGKRHGGVSIRNVTFTTKCLGKEKSRTTGSWMVFYHSPALMQILPPAI